MEILAAYVAYLFLLIPVGIIWFLYSNVLSEQKEWNLQAGMIYKKYDKETLAAIKYANKIL